MSDAAALMVIANKKLAEAETNGRTVNWPDRWLASVVMGLRKEYAGRLATMPRGLSVTEQVKWLEQGPPAQGLRIPSTPMHPVCEPLPPEVIQRGLEEARRALAQAT